ncbi:TPA: GTPase HflX [Candidatus Poribacteria bacterium]|nr:GTPase HflX [Candidatus Poribacteria bacterium]HIO77421.1 GTPase HflX [Candidatus Poribacteria bacterium]
MHLNYNTEIQSKKAVLVGIKLRHDIHSEVEESIRELADLATTSGIKVTCELIQTKAAPNAAHFIGQGKLGEIKITADQTKSEIVVFDADLSPAQTRNIEKILNLVVIDRTGLILQIFAQRAQTKEAKLQVNLAQLQYALPRLTRMWTHLSRQATAGSGAASGGTGQSGGAVRGAGETQLQIDRKLISHQISHLKKVLRDVERQRQVQRHNRAKIVNISLVGYTNAGKSTLFNALTSADQLAEDKLFATLDPTTRTVELPKNQEVLLTDTVGFIKKLPHQLVAAFKATLEEVAESNLLLHIVDASHSQIDLHIQIVNNVLQEIGASNVPSLIVFNKIDQVNEELLCMLQIKHPKSLMISALQGDGTQNLKSHIADIISKHDICLSISLSYQDAKALDYLYNHGHVVSADYRTEEILIQAQLPRRHLKPLDQLLINSTHTIQ